MVGRQEIAQSLDGVTAAWSGGTIELSGSPYRPAALALWQAFPDWQSSRWLARCVIESTWNVYVILPATDPEAFSSATDALLDPVRDALSALGHVQQVSPIALVSAEQSITMPALNFALLT